MVFKRIGVVHTGFAICSGRPNSSIPRSISIVSRSSLITFIDIIFHLFLSKCGRDIYYIFERRVMTLMLSTDYMSYREVESKIMTLYSYFNGKVNKILPATELNFSNSRYIPVGSCDRTTGAILFSL